MKTLLALLAISLCTAVGFKSKQRLLAQTDSQGTFRGTTISQGDTLNVGDYLQNGLF